MSQIKLISVNVLYNYAEQGDNVYITARWQNCGEDPFFDAEIAADFVYSGRHRRDETQQNSFRTTWRPFPRTYNWKKGKIFDTTGVWTVPATWGATFDLNISLIAENGEAVKFIGKNSVETFCQRVGEIDLGWGWGRTRLLEQRKPLFISINEITDFENNDIGEVIALNGFNFKREYPAVVGMKDASWNDFEPIVSIRRVSDNKKAAFIGNREVEYKVALTDNQVTYKAETDYCDFDVVFRFENGYFEASVENVFEKPNCELLSIEIPSLAEMSAEDTVFTNFYSGGRVTKLKDTFFQSAELYYDACNTVSASSSDGTLCLDADDVENVLYQSVVGNSDKRAVMLSCKIITRIEAKKAGLKSIPVKLTPLKVCYSDENNPLFSAEIIRKKLNGEYPQLYKDTLVYKIRVDALGQYHPDKPATKASLKILSLKDVEQMIMSIYHLSRGMRQVVYIVGWQDGGHDFSYPYPHRLPFNERVGTREEFNSLKERLKAYNIELSIHDNFDDFYLSDKYEINKDIICLDEYGELWKGWLWAGGMSYIIDPNAYIKSGEMQERIDTVLKDYGIEGSYHLDVLTSEVRRYSFNETDPLSAEDGINAKIKIVEAFNKKGIDVTSETLALPFVGKIGYSQNTRYRFNGNLFYGDKIIPLTTIAFHGATPYKVSAGDDKLSILRAIALGGACSIEMEGNTVVSRRSIYLSSIPMGKLAYSKVVNASVDGNKWTFTYENGRVEVDFNAESYTVEVEGSVVSKNFTTFMPINETEYCYYSADGGLADISLIKDWEKATVLEIDDNGEKERLEINIFDSFEAKPDTPYILRKSEEQR